MKVGGKRMMVIPAKLAYGSKAVGISPYACECISSHLFISANYGYVYIYICMYKHAHTRTHTHAHICIRTRTHTRTHVHKYTRIHRSVSGDHSRNITSMGGGVCCYMVAKLHRMPVVELFPQKSH